MPARRLQTGRAVRLHGAASSIRYRPTEALWDASFVDGSAGTFRGVIVAEAPRSRVWPAWSGPYAGAVRHGRDYIGPEALRGKRVLVVGGGSTGCAVASDAARVAASTDWSLRRGYWFLPETLLGRRTLDLARPWVSGRVRRPVLERLVRRVVGPYERYGLPAPDHALFEAHPSPITDVLPHLDAGRIRVRPDVADAEGDTLRFVDGARERYDLVVCATGCRVALPFLPEGAVPFEGDVAQLYGAGVRPDLRHLYVLGTQQVRFGDGPLIEPTARLVARWIRLQDRIAPNLGEVLEDLGMPLPDVALVEPHAALRQLWWHRLLLDRLVERHARKAYSSSKDVVPPDEDAGARDEGIGSSAPARRT